MGLVSVRSNAHFYFPDGEPCYEVAMSSKPGKTRPTNVADARKMGLLPSVTNIISLLDKPMLNAWRVEQGIMSAITLPRIEGESEDDFARRVVADSENQTDSARKIGTLLHEACENYVTLRRGPEDPLIAPLFEPFRLWWEANCEEAYYCETPVVGTGYAGRVDCKARLAGIGSAIIDFKGRKFSKEGKAGVYDEDALQLSAYREADALARPMADTCVSILINNVAGSEPRLHVHVWDREELRRYFAAFTSIRLAWNLLKKFTPINQ